MYHLQGDLMFEREADGAVRILKKSCVAIGDYEEPEFTVLDITVDASAWASLVAAMSARGEGSETFERALDFHGAE